MGIIFILKVRSCIISHHHCESAIYVFSAVRFDVCQRIKNKLIKILFISALERGE